MPTSASFQRRVQAEPFPRRCHWSRKETFALSLLPLLLLLPPLIDSLWHPSRTTMASLDTAWRGLLFLSLCVLYQNMLKQHWQRFKCGGWRSWALVFIGAIALQLCIGGVKLFLPTTVAIDSTEPDDFNLGLGLLLGLSLGPIFTALIEDIVFRYTLLHKLFFPNKLWQIGILLGNSALFGLVHYHNVNGHLWATLSFMAAGLLLNLIYLWTRNIWHVLLIHTLNNAVLSLGGVLLLMLLHAFGLTAT